MIKKSCKLTISIVCGWFPVVCVEWWDLNGKDCTKRGHYHESFSGGGVLKYEKQIVVNKYVMTIFW